MRRSNFMCRLLFQWLAAALAGLVLLGGRACVCAEISTLRPRLLVRADEAQVGLGPTVAAIRARRLQPALAEYSTLDARKLNWEGILTPSLKALLLGDLETRDEVRNWLLSKTQPSPRSSARQSGGTMAIAFDWLHPLLTEAERYQIASNVRVVADAALLFLRNGEPDINHNFTYMSLFAIAMAGLALHGEPGFEADSERFLRATRAWLEGDGGIYEACEARGGGWPEGTQYSLTECTRLLILTMHGLRSATDEDPFRLVRERHGDFLRGTARFYMALTRPDFTLERLGDVNRFKPLLRDQHRFVIEALADGLRFDGGDAREPAMLQHFSDRIHAHYGRRDTHRNHRWGMLLFADPDAPRDPSSYLDQPLAQVFGRGSLDLVVIRDTWDVNGTMITFQAGDHFVDHQHFDKGAFTIFHRGALAIDSGAYDRMYSAHHREWATRTIAHNAPLVFDPERPLPEKHTADGGQIVLRGLQHHENWQEYLAHRSKEQLDAADLLRFSYGRAIALVDHAAPDIEQEDTSPPRSGGTSAAGVGEPARPPAPASFARYAIAQAELAGAYGGQTRRLQRTLAYWPGAQIVVVHDDFELDAPLTVAFQLHTQAAPRAAGAPLPAPGCVEMGQVPWWVVTRKGSLELPKTEMIYDGRLFLRTVAPETSRAWLVGGKGYEWHRNGVNYSPASSGNPPRESGRWRIEVRSLRPAQRHIMTHVMQVAEAGQFQMAEARVLAVEDHWYGTHVSSAPEVVLLASVEPAAKLPLQYEFDALLPSLHLVVGLEPLQRVAVRAGDVTASLSVDAEGVLAFHDPVVGAHRVRLSNDID